MNLLGVHIGVHSVRWWMRGIPQGTNHSVPRYDVLTSLLL